MTSIPKNNDFFTRNSIRKLQANLFVLSNHDYCDQRGVNLPKFILIRRPQLRQNGVVKMDRSAALETSVRIRDLDDEMKQDDIAFGKLKLEFEEKQRTYQQNNLKKSKLRAELDQKLRGLILQRNTTSKNTATTASTSKKRQNPENVEQDERNQQGKAGHEEGIIEFNILMQFGERIEYSEH